jgi:hypothetical protein
MMVKVYLKPERQYVTRITVHECLFISDSYQPS